MVIWQLDDEASTEIDAGDTTRSASGRPSEGGAVERERTGIVKCAVCGEQVGTFVGEVVSAGKEVSPFSSPRWVAEGREKARGCDFISVKSVGEPRDTLLEAGMTLPRVGPFENGSPKKSISAGGQKEGNALATSASRFPCLGKAIRAEEQTQVFPGPS